MTWLVTGGAGYIGSHVIRALQGYGLQVTVLDDLSSGFKQRIPEGIQLIEGDIRDSRKLNILMKNMKLDGVINLAALKSVEESELKPAIYYEINSNAVEQLLSLCEKFGIRKFIQSSTAAVYGNFSGDFVKENDSPHPESIYGKSKLKAEEALNRKKIHNNFAGTNLRYFNVLGSSDSLLRDTSKENLVPNVLMRLSQGKAPIIFGDDYDTPDGSCVRDYVHVEDIARAHLCAVIKLETARLPPAINIGTGRGYSVKEIIAIISRLVGTDISPVVGKRRKGDLAKIIADVKLAAEQLDFESKRSLEDMISTSI